MGEIHHAHVLPHVSPRETEPRTLGQMLYTVCTVPQVCETQALEGKVVGLPFEFEHMIREIGPEGQR